MPVGMLMLALVRLRVERDTDDDTHLTIKQCWY